MDYAAARLVKPMFPVIGGEVSCGYWQARPLSVPKDKRVLKHRAWDVIRRAQTAEATAVVQPPVSGSSILSPEDGQLVFQCGYRTPDVGQGLGQPMLADQTFPDGRWFWGSNLYHDNYGCITHLWGKSGLIYTFCHQHDYWFWHLARTYLVSTNVIRGPTDREGMDSNWSVKMVAYNQYVKMFLTLRNPIAVMRGSVVGYLGDSGYSESPHVHMEVRVSDKYEARIDPAAVWSDRLIAYNDDGPQMGERVGVEALG